MPSDFKCAKCELRFSTGNYHYHVFDSGFIGRQLMVCTACGTQHAVELALEDRGPEFYPAYQVIVEAVPSPAPPKLVRQLRQLSQIDNAEALKIIRGGAFTLLSEASDAQVSSLRKELEPLGITLRVEETGRRRNSWFGPRQQDRLMYHAGPQMKDGHPEWLTQAEPLDQEAIGREAARLTCMHCKQAGHLTSDFDEKVDSCPACNTLGVVEASFWVT